MDNEPVAIPSFSEIPAWVKLLVEAGAVAPSADNSQPWGFKWDGESLALRLDPKRGSQGLSSDHPVVQLAMGAVIENLYQAAESIGMVTANWQWGHFQLDGASYLEVPATETTPADGEVPAWIRDRHTNRGKFQRTPLPSTVTQALDGFREGKLGIRLTGNREQISEMGRLVGLASEIRFQTEEVHRWLQGSLRFEPGRAEAGLDVDTLCLPPGGKQLLRFISKWERMQMLNRIKAYKLFAAIERQQFGQCGAVVTVEGPEGAEPSDWVDAGRLMERAWLELTRHQLAVHPYFVLPDVFYRYAANIVPEHLREQAKTIIDATQELFGTPGRMPFMVLRVGIAQQKVKRSRRLPLVDLVEMG